MTSRKTNNRLFVEADLSAGEIVRQQKLSLAQWVLFALALVSGIWAVAQEHILGYRGGFIPATLNIDDYCAGLRGSLKDSCNGLEKFTRFVRDCKPVRSHKRAYLPHGDRGQLKAYLDALGQELAEASKHRATLD